MSKTTAANQFGENIHGFTHLEIRPDRLIVRHVSDTGSLLHGFSKSAAGQVQIL